MATASAVPHFDVQEKKRKLAMYTQNRSLFCLLLRAVAAAALLSTNLLANSILEYGKTRTWTDREGRELIAAFKGFADNGGGVLLERQSDNREFTVPFEQLSDSERHFLSTELQVVTARLRILQVLENGIMASGSGFIGPKLPQEYQRKVREKGTGLRSHEIVERTVTETRMRAPSAEIGDRVFVTMNTSGLVDDDIVKVRMWEEGTFAYTTVLGGRATIKKFTTRRPIDK